MPPEVNENCQKPQGPIGLIRKECHGYVNSLRICTDIPGGICGQ